MKNPLTPQELTDTAVIVFVFVVIIVLLNMIL
jgi:hypothetical protein